MRDLDQKPIPLRHHLLSAGLIVGLVTVVAVCRRGVLRHGPLDHLGRQRRVHQQARRLYDGDGGIALRAVMLGVNQPQFTLAGVGDEIAMSGPPVVARLGRMAFRISVSGLAALSPEDQKAISSQMMPIAEIPRLVLKFAGRTSMVMLLPSSTVSCVSFSNMRWNSGRAVSPKMAEI